MALPGADQAMELSLFDNYYAPRIFMTTALGYSMESLGRSGSDILVEVLREMVVHTANAWPILKSRVVLDPRSNGMKMVALKPDPAVDFQNAVFTLVKHNTGTTPGYAELETANFAPAKFDSAKLCRHHTHPDPNKPAPVFAVQCNIIEGGIVIGFQLHHSIADGKSLAQISEHMKALLLQKAPPPVSAPVLRVSDLEDKLKVGDPQEVVKGCPDRFLAKSGGVKVLLQNQHKAASHVIQALLLTPSSNIASLRDRANAALQSIKGPSAASLSKNDVLAAFFWSCITAARVQAGIIKNTMQSSLYIPCDCRKRMSPQLPSNYFGSATLMVKIPASVEGLLLAVSELQKHDNILPLAKLGLMIRTAVSGVNNDYIMQRLQLAKSVEAANVKATESELTQIMSTFNPDANIDVVSSSLAPIFNVEDTTLGPLSPGFCRALHHTSSNGVVDVIPGMVKDRSEMTMALDRVVMDRLVKMEVWNAMIDRTII